MKMDWSNSGVFWGGILILVGLGTMINAVFHWKIPVVRVAVAFIFIYYGVVILTGGFRIKDGHPGIFGNVHVDGANLSKDNTVIFGSGEFDLTEVQLAAGDVKTTIDLVFSSGVIKIDPDMPVLVHVSAAFASAKLPNDGVQVLGGNTYKTAGYREGKKHLEIEANVVFGSLEVVER
ncbi:MAG: hypothetical protein ACM3WV_02490 [Bacillota bacterium]